MNMLDKHSSPNSAASGPSSVGVPSGGSTPSSVAATLPLPPSSSSSSVAQSPVPDCLGRPPSQPNPNQLMSQQASLQQQQPPPPHPSQSCSNSQLGPGSVGGPPSVSSAGPHTPLMMGDPSLSGPPPPIQSQPSLSQQVPSGPSSQSSMQPDLSLSAPNGRPNVSTPSSMFNTSAPNTPAMSDMNLPNIQSPALHQQQPPPPSQHPQMDPFGEQKLYSHGPSSVPPPSNNCNNPVMSPAPMSVPPPGQCPPDPPKTKGKRKASTNSNNANNGPGTPFANPGTPGTPGPNTSNGMMSNMPPIKNEPMMSPFGSNGMMQNNMNNCMPPMNGTMSPFDPDSKMNMFNPMNDFNPNMPNDHCGMPPMNMRNPHQQHLPPPPNCSMGMNMPPGMSPGMPPGMPPGSHMHGPPPPPPGMLNQQMPPGRMMGGPGGPPGPVGGPMPGMGPGPKASPMDPQYMQHQSQIFVFNTTMANQAADAVSETVFESIIDFHLAQQVTKDFMDKHNVKIQNVNKTNGNMWAMRGGPLPGMRMRGPNPNGMGPPRPGFGQQGPPCFPPFNGPSPGPNGAPMGYGGPPPPNSWPPNPMNDFGPRGPRPGFGGPGGPPPPSFNKFNPNMPNYPMGNDSQDLTPQQRQSREQKLAILQNIKDSFCPEMNDNPGMPPGMGGPPNDFLNIDSQMGMSGPGMMGPGGDMMPPFGGPDSFMGPGGYQGNPMMGGHGGHPPPPPPGMFHDEPVAPPPPPPATSGRKRKNQQNQQQPPPQPPMPHPPGVNSPNSCGPNRIPPPPYNPGLHRQMSSPHPASPATSLGMPSTSPRGQSYGPPRSGQTTPSGDPMAGIGTSPKSRSPNKRTKANAQQAAAALALDNDIMGFQHKSEPALMPVPSPKQLDYNSTFEGQELTIEKQPNMHFQENDFLGSGDMSNDIFGNEFDHLGSNDPISGRPFSNPGMPGGFGGPPPNGFGPGPDGFRGPPPNQFGSSPCDPSMKGPPFDMNFGGPGGPPPSGGPPGMNDPMMFPNGGPPGGFDPSGPEPPMSSSHLANLQKMAPPFDIKDGNMMPGQKGPPMMNNGPMMGNNGPRPMSFDPNFPPEMNDPNYPMHMQGPPPPMGYGGGPPPPGPGPNYSNGPGRMPTGPNGEMLGFPPGMHPNNQYLGPPPMMDGPGSNGPSPMPSMGPGQGPPQRFTHNQNAPRPPMNPSPNPSQSPNSRYDFSPNVQVKPNAPNTIQYLPNRPQGPPGPPNSRPPPNLDFLQQSLNMGPGGPPPSGPGGKMPNSNGGPPGSPFYQGGPNPGQMPPRPPNMQQHMNFGPRGPPMMRPGMGPNGQDMMQRPQLGPPPGSRPMGMPPNGGPTPPGFGSGGMPPMNKMMGGLPGGPPLPGQGPPPPGLPPGHDGHFNNYKHSFQPPPPSDMPYDPSFQAFQRQLYSNNNARPASGPRMPTNY